MATFGMVDVLVDETPGCAGCARRWKAETAPRRVTRVRYDPESGPQVVCDVVGWSSAGGPGPCPAQGVLVEDSGGGTAMLVWGGDLGLRLTPQDGGPTVGEPFVLLAPEDVL